MDKIFAVLLTALLLSSPQLLAETTDVRPESIEISKDGAVLLQRAEALVKDARLAGERKTEDGYREAARFYSQAAETVWRVDQQLAHQYQYQQGVAIGNLGRQFKDKAARLEAVAIWKRLAGSCDPDREEKLCAQIQLSIGNALIAVADRTDISMKQEGVAALRRGLQSPLVQADAKKHARYQCVLGNALMRLGYDTPGTTDFDASAQAHRAAMKSWAQLGRAQKVAEEQYLFAGSLYLSADRDRSLAKVNEALAACDAALAVLAGHDEEKARLVRKLIERAGALQKRLNSHYGS